MAVKPQSRCIFCDGTPLTKEHLYPQWAHALLPDSTAGTTEFWRKAGPTEADRLDKTRPRQGSTLHYTFKVVCAQCNNGWMSKIEQNIKPALISIIQGTRLDLSDDNYKPLVEWATLKVMVIDASSKEMQTFTRDQRFAFMSERKIPDFSTLWLIRCGLDDWRSRFLRTLFAFSPPLSPTGPSPLTADLSSVALGFGEGLFFFNHGRSEIKFKKDLFISSGLLLHPPEGRQRSWPPVGRLSAEKATFAATSLDRNFGTPLHP
jgi:hypothetical protein